MVKIEICKFYKTRGFIEGVVVMYNTIIDNLCKDKQVIDTCVLSFDMVEEGISGNVVAHNTQIYEGQLEDTIDFLRKMLE